MPTARLNHLIHAIASTMIAHADELSALDAAIGDGDHGHNMMRGAQAVLLQLPELEGRPLPEVLQAAGMQIVLKVGGASGPLVGTLVMELGKNLPPEPTRADFAAALEAAFVAVQARGKSQEGHKTLLDVLGPVVRSLKTQAGCQAVKQVARAAAGATVPLRAARGRASFLGERSVGHMDPGAYSMCLMIGAVCDEFILERAAL